MRVRRRVSSPRVAHTNERLLERLDARLHAERRPFVPSRVIAALAHLCDELEDDDDDGHGVSVRWGEKPALSGYGIFRFAIEPPRRAPEQIDAGSQPSVRVRRRVSSMSSETVPSQRTSIFRRFCDGRRRATLAPQAICARSVVAPENGKIGN